VSKVADQREALEHVRTALSGLRFGEVVIAVHDGVIVQIARTEKIRPNRTDR
jgi:hypothetical protein